MPLKTTSLTAALLIVYAWSCRTSAAEDPPIPPTLDTVERSFEANLDQLSAGYDVRGKFFIHRHAELRRDPEGERSRATPFDAGGSEPEVVEARFIGFNGDAFVELEGMRRWVFLGGSYGRVVGDVDETSTVEWTARRPASFEQLQVPAFNIDFARRRWLTLGWPSDFLRSYHDVSTSMRVVDGQTAVMRVDRDVAREGQPADMSHREITVRRLPGGHWVPTHILRLSTEGQTIRRHDLVWEMRGGVAVPVQVRSEHFFTSDENARPVLLETSGWTLDPAVSIMVQGDDRIPSSERLLTHLAAVGLPRLEAPGSTTPRPQSAATGQLSAGSVLPILFAGFVFLGTFLLWKQRRAAE